MVKIPTDADVLPPSDDHIFRFHSRISGKYYRAFLKSKSNSLKSFYGDGDTP